jgi:NitT/TauT family transport system ATP-binding protein
MPGPILQLVGISKTYSSESGATVQALENFNMTVEEREFVTVIGPTGCGKTTLLNIIAGLDSQDGGDVFLADGVKPGTNVPCVFQHYTLFPWRTLLRNVVFGLEMRGTPRTERHAAAFELLSKVGLTGFENAYPHELSGGMRQRAAIAQALASRPRLLLMDEPFGSVDDMTRNDLQRMIVELWQETRITILFVTHNIDEAIAVGDRVVILSGRPGRVVQEIAVPYERPRDRMSREFVDIFVQIRQSLSSTMDR